MDAADRTKSFTRKNGRLFLREKRIAIWDKLGLSISVVKIK
jgi:hypothetical protein